MKLKTTNRRLRLSLKGLKGSYILQKYLVDASTRHTNKFLPVDEKEVVAEDTSQELLTLSPYSMVAIVLKKKPQEIPVAAETIPTPLRSHEANVTAPAKKENNVANTTVSAASESEAEAKTSAVKN